MRAGRSRLQATCRIRGHQEFLATEAVDRIGGTRSGLSGLDHPSQDIIASEMVELVVDALEVVEVDLQQAIGGAVAVDMRADSGQVLAESSPVAGTGQGVDARLRSMPQVYCVSCAV